VAAVHIVQVRQKVQEDQEEVVMEVEQMILKYLHHLLMETQEQQTQAVEVVEQELLVEVQFLELVVKEL